MPVSCSSSFTLGTLCVSVDATKRTAVRTLQQQYGDGYMARRADGINTLMETWDVSTVYGPIEELQKLEQEIIALGSLSFTWTAPYDKTPKEWVLDPYQWDWRFEAGLAQLSFTLKRYNR
jgi:phage-related protein